MDSDIALNRIFMITERMIIFDGLEDVFEHILKTAVALTDAEAATIRVFDIASGTLNIVRGYGVTEGFLSQPPLRVGQGISGKVVQDGKPFTTQDVKTESLCHYQELAQLEGIHSMICVPMKSSEGAIGCISVYRKTPQAFSDHELLLLSIFSSEAVQAVEKTRMLNELKKQATLDHLTGFYNKKTFISILETELSRARRHQDSLALMFIDLDKFKLYNDTFGHLMGDKLIHDFAQQLKQTCRKMDIVGRFGGDEFVIIAPQTDQNGAQALAEKIRRGIAHFPFQTTDPHTHFNMSCSIGISHWSPDCGGSPSVDSLLSEADDALYLSKKSGRNCISLAGKHCHAEAELS